MDYGSDAFYAELAWQSLQGWRAWNREWGQTLYHEVGILLLSREGLERGGFEAESFDLLRRRGVPLERLDAARRAERFPAWAGASYADGYFNPWAGFAESGRVMARLVDLAADAGVLLRQGRRCRRLLEAGSRVAGIELDDASTIRADTVVVAAGAWTPVLLPHLERFMWPTAQPVVHLRPADPRPFDGRHFPVWCADIARTGWYGFPLTASGVLKFGHHGPGRRLGPGEPLQLLPEEQERLARFAAQTFPQLAGATVAASRLCLYCDSWDGNFLIDHDPQRPGLCVAAGGSGHGFKFAPVLGAIIADVVEGQANPQARRFAWRSPGTRTLEQARFS
jgi:glycine/D-amino acid oxidase-like deaminating enzyme